LIILTRIRSLVGLGYTFASSSWNAINVVVSTVVVSRNTVSTIIVSINTVSTIIVSINTVSIIIVSTYIVSTITVVSGINGEAW